MNKIQTILHKYSELGLSFGAGALATLAFAPNRIAWFAILSVALFYFCLQKATPKQAALRGWCYGLGLFGFGLSWLHIVMHDHGAMPLALAWVLTVIFASLLSLLFAAQASLVIRYGQLETRLGRFGFFPLSWVVFEWIRSTLFTGFPWLLLGVSQTNGPLGNFLPWVGIGGTTFIVVALGVAVTICLQQVGKLSKARALAALTLLGLHYLIPIVPFWALVTFFIYNILFLRNQTTWAFTLFVGIYLSAGIVSHYHFTEVEKTLDVSMVQVNVPNRLKWDPSEMANTINKYVTLSEPVWQSDVVIWPEGILPVVKQEIPGLIEKLQQQAVEHDTTLILGLPSYNTTTQRYHNSLFVLGKEEGEYHKRHLVPFGEFVPFQQLIRGIFSFLDLPMSALTAGEKKQSALTAKETAIAPFICFETAYSEYLADALPTATLLIALSDDSWFGESNAGQQHLQIGQALAAMGERDLLHSTNTGVTALVKSNGLVARALPPHQPGVLTVTVEARTGMTPWAWLNQWPVWSWLSNLLLIVLIMLGRKHVQQTTSLEATSCSP